MGEEGQQLGKIEAAANEHGIDHVAVGSAQVVARQTVIAFGVADNRFNRIASFEKLLDCGGHFDREARDHHRDVFGMVFLAAKALVHHCLFG
ncbi:MAG: hypothetical protein ACT4QE_16030 [Anaerolineales bacterium]